MNQALIRKVADRVICTKTTDWAMDIEQFDWVPGVGLYGLFLAYEATGQQRYWEFLAEWFSRHLPEAAEKKTVNSTAPLLTAACMYEKVPDPQYRKVMEAAGEFILREAPKTVDGGLEHTVTEPVAGFSDQIWADTLFMACIFLAKLGRITGNQVYTDFAAEQFVIHHRLLSDGAGLYFHGYNGGRRNHMSAVRWGRANAWILYATTAMLEICPDFPQRPFLIERVQTHIRELTVVQAKGGGFRTVLDDPAAYVEISATAGIAAGLGKAIQLGIVGKEYGAVQEKALAAVKAAVFPDGLVDGVSSGTPVMPDAAAYKQIPIVPTLYGQGLALAAFCTGFETCAEMCYNGSAI